jgi:DNA (cytosine-5)-methyltransferase 1
LLLSLFCGAGGLDLGFEKAGFSVGLAFDRNSDSVLSYNENRPEGRVAQVGDVAALSPKQLDFTFKGRFSPSGVIGGPPCQSFSQANVHQFDDDPRHNMPIAFASLLGKLNRRDPVDFFVMENVVGLTLKRHQKTLAKTLTMFRRAGFAVEQAILDAKDYGTPQNRRRLFVVGFNKQKFPNLRWVPPDKADGPTPTVRDTISWLPHPAFFERGLECETIDPHPNHWCMAPKSPKFQKAGALEEGDIKSRSFKTLAWDKPSIAVAYGHREVHIHPTGTRRLSVYEAMLLQGFPREYRLHGNLSSQIRQVSEAVPLPLALAVARSVSDQLADAALDRVVQFHRPDRKIAEPIAPLQNIVVR